jgi:hypothetical protein
MRDPRPGWDGLATRKTGGREVPTHEPPLTGRPAEQAQLRQTALWQGKTAPAWWCAEVEKAVLAFAACSPNLHCGSCGPSMPASPPCLPTKTTNQPYLSMYTYGEMTGHLYMTCVSVTGLPPNKAWPAQHSRLSEFGVGSVPFSRPINSTQSI